MTVKARRILAEKIRVAVSVDVGEGASLGLAEGHGKGAVMQHGPRVAAGHRRRRLAISPLGEWIGGDKATLRLLERLDQIEIDAGLGHVVLPENGDRLCGRLWHGAMLRTARSILWNHNSYVVIPAKAGTQGCRDVGCPGSLLSQGRRSLL